MDKPFLHVLTKAFDSRGVLTPLNYIPTRDGTQLPVKRVFFITNVPADSARGGHAHRNCHQMIVAVAGSFRVSSGDSTVILSNTEYGMCIPPGNFVDLSGFSAGAICLIIASEPYDPNDFIFASKESA